MNQVGVNYRLLFMAIALFIGGTISVYKVIFPIEPSNRIFGSSFVIGCYGLTLLEVSRAYHVFTNLQSPLFLFSTITFLICFILGLFVAYIRGSDEQREKLKLVPKQILSLLVLGAVLMGLVIIFFRWVQPIILKFFQ